MVDLADACRLVLSCLQLRLIGMNANDFPAPPAAIGGDHFSVRLILAIEGGRDDPDNRATNAYLGRVTHRYRVEKGRLRSSSTRIVRMHLPTLREAIELVRACPHLRLVADTWPVSSR